MSLCIPDFFCTLVPAQSSRIAAGPHISAGMFRLATDPSFYADLVLKNIVAGSRYRVTRASDGAELATGVVPGSGLVDYTVAGVACFDNPMQVNITVRNASGTPQYKVFDTAASMVKAGTSAYVLQQED